MMETIKLIIFDVDDTLVRRDTEQPLPEVEAWFAINRNKYNFAIASNQGGVGLRHWMEIGEFGEPSKYPTEDDAKSRIRRIGLMFWITNINMAFAYQSKRGNWSPTPEGKEHDTSWRMRHRKPDIGMLNRAMLKAGVKASETMFVGDLETDQQAAIKAQIKFEFAREFFRVVRERN